MAQATTLLVLGCQQVSVCCPLTPRAIVDSACAVHALCRLIVVCCKYFKEETKQP